MNDPKCGFLFTLNGYRTLFRSMLLAQDMAQLQKMDEDLFSEQLYCLGMYFCEALIAVETNFSRHPVRVLRSYGYKNIYASSGEEYCGFLTTSVTRPIMLANLVSVMRECIYLETDRDTLLEMLDFVKHPTGKAQASSGKHDDLVISSAIARYVGLSYDMQIRVKKSGWMLGKL